MLVKAQFCSTLNVGENLNERKKDNIAGLLRHTGGVVRADIALWSRDEKWVRGRRRIRPTAHMQDQHITSVRQEQDVNACESPYFVCRVAEGLHKEDEVDVRSHVADQTREPGLIQLSKKT